MDRRRADLHGAMRSMVLPFVLEHHEQWHGRQTEADVPYLEIEAFDDQGNAAPVGNSAAVLEILLSDELRPVTRENVRLEFDDPNDGAQRTPPFNYDDVHELRRLTLRVLQDFVDETTDLLFEATDPTSSFDRVYDTFESAFFSDTYICRWFSTLSNLIFTRGGEVVLEDDYVIRRLMPLEYTELEARHRHVRQGAAPRMALVQTMRPRKGALLDFAGRVPPGEARGKVVFCVRVLRPGGVFSDQLAKGKQTCWRFDIGESTFFTRASPSDNAPNTVLDEHDGDNLITLWRAIRGRQDFNLRFLATKLEDASRRDSVLDRFADVAVALQNIFGSEGHRFASAMAWALRGHRDASARREIYELAREVNLRRNAVLHGNTDRLRELLADPRRFNEFTDRAELCLRQALELLLLNDDFRARLDDAVLGAAANFRRLPYTF